MTQRDLAHRVGMTEQMFSNVLAGRRSFKAREVDAIRRAFGFSLPEDRPTTVAVAGRVGAGDHIMLVNDFERGDGLYHVARPAWLPAHEVVAAEISGSSAEPWALDGDLIFWRREVMGVMAEDVGRPVVAKIDDGRIVLKRLLYGSGPDLWTLTSLNPLHPNIVDVRLEWAARVLPPLPRDQVRRA